MAKKISSKFKPRIHSIMRGQYEVSFSWRLFKIIGEFVAGFDFLKKFGLSVTFFGTARCTTEDKIYEEAVKLAQGLVKKGFAIITGGGPGIMEAANKGATLSGGRSVGLNIQLPSEQRVNQYVKQSQAFHYFFTRKVMLAYASEVYVFFPGGYGTLDELFEILTLVQTRKIRRIPIILVDAGYWQPLLKWLETDLVDKYKALDKSDAQLYYLAKDANDALRYVDSLISRGKIFDSQEVPVEYSDNQDIRK